MGGVLGPSPEADVRVDEIVFGREEVSMRGAGALVLIVDTRVGESDVTKSGELEAALAMLADAAAPIMVRLRRENHAVDVNMDCTAELKFRSDGTMLRGAETDLVIRSEYFDVKLFFAVTSRLINFE